MVKYKYGYLRETQEIADKVGTNKITGLCRTGLDTYLKVIFPKVKDWIHNKVIPDSGRLCRPDYRSEKLKLIVEFDGMPHYTNPENVLGDIEKTKFYQKLGYKVVRIPFFIQLTNEVVEQLFGVKVNKNLFPDGYWSMSIHDQCTPAFFCPLGIKRMQKEFVKFPKQLQYNLYRLQIEEKQLGKIGKQLAGVNYLVNAAGKVK